MPKIVPAELEISVKNFVKDMTRNISSIMDRGRGEADRITHAARSRVETWALESQKLELFAELGEVLYGQYRKPGGKRNQKAILQLVTQIREIDRLIASLKKGIRKAPGAGEKKGRRGRPRKAEKAGGKRRGRPPKAEKGKTRRGRPPKKARAAKAVKPPRKSRSPRKAPEAPPVSAPGAAE